MPNAPIFIPSFMGGVSRLSQNQRAPFEMEAVDNCDMNPTRGAGKRPGTEHIAGEGTNESLDLTLIADGFAFWINRSATERFVGFIDPDAADDLDIIQVFNIVDGTRQTVEALDSGGSEVALDDADADVVAMVAYLASGSQTIRQRFRALTVEDSTFLLNREVTVALEGAAITYRDAAMDEIRNQNHAQNVATWADLDQPPTVADSYPDRATLVSGGPIDSDDNWYVRDDDLGLPQGFWRAISATQPPWYQRLPTEPANSFLQRDTMPLRLAYTGSKFVLQFVDWTPRYAGDGTTNPGPTFVGLTLNDMAFHQGRFWFLAGERVVSSQVNDLFNLWIDSISAGLTDADPIDRGIQGRRISNGLFAETFRESLIIITDGNRQVEIRANGPITPRTVQLYDSTNKFAVGYVEPVIQGDSLYFASERDFAMQLWRYDYDPQQVNNIARDITRRIHGYIPAEAHWMATSDAHDQLFMLTLADPDAVYVLKEFMFGDREHSSWYRWVYPQCDEVVSIEVFDDFLYMVMKRTDSTSTKFYLERQPLGLPQQDTDGSPAQTLGYATRMDRKVKVQGVFDGTDTTWTLPFEATDQDMHVVLAGTWDTDDEKAAGTEVPVIASVSGGVTVLTASGDWENNFDGDDAPAHIGVYYRGEVELSEQFVRGDGGQILHGNTHLMRMKIRYRDSGGFSILLTPEGRDEVTSEFVVPDVGPTPFDSDQLDDYGEFQTRLLSHAHNTRIRLVNDTPFPTDWVDAEIQADFIPQSYSPVR